jgi:AAA domain
MVGDSGIGKSPLSYELGLCIAAGVPFLGIRTTQGRVLYLDYEDDPALMISYARTIARKLGLTSLPSTFRLWSPAMDDTPNRSPFELIKKYTPDFVIIDTLSTAFPLAEVENNNATELYKHRRATGAAVMFTHHLKKDSSTTEDSGWDLDLDRETTVKDFQDVRGAGALVNTAHLRMKLIRARANDEDWAFIVRFYRRGKGGMPTLSIGRVMDDNGNPIGHRRLGGLARLNPNYRKIFADLPERFRFEDLAERGLKGGSRTQFIHACEAAKILSTEKDGDYYVKLPGWKDGEGEETRKG